MKHRILSIWIALLLFGAESASAGIGVFSDSNGSDCNLTLPNLVPTSIYVLYLGQGGPEATGAEYRIDGMPGRLGGTYTATLINAPGSNLNLGHAFDGQTHNVAWPAPQPFDVNGNLLVATWIVTNMGAPIPPGTRLIVRGFPFVQVCPGTPPLITDASFNIICQERRRDDRQRRAALHCSCRAAHVDRGPQPLSVRPATGHLLAKPRQAASFRRWNEIVDGIVGVQRHVWRFTHGHESIDLDLLEVALRVGGEKTKKATVTRALQEYITRRKQTSSWNSSASSSGKDRARRAWHDRPGTRGSGRVEVHAERDVERGLPDSPGTSSIRRVENPKRPSCHHDADAGGRPVRRLHSVS
jgi:hypothetical protein